MRLCIRRLLLLLCCDSCVASLFFTCVLHTEEERLSQQRFSRLTAHGSRGSSPHEQHHERTGNALFWRKPPCAEKNNLMLPGKQWTMDNTRRPKKTNTHATITSDDGHTLLTTVHNYTSAGAGRYGIQRTVYRGPENALTTTM